MLLILSSTILFNLGLSLGLDDLSYDLAASLHEVEAFDVLILVCDHNLERDDNLAGLAHDLAANSILLSVVHSLEGIDAQVRG